MKQEKYNPRNDPFYVEQKLDEEEFAMVEATSDPEFLRKLEQETEEERQQRKDDFYKQFNLNKVTKRNIEFETKDLENLRQDLANNGVRDQEQAISVFKSFLKSKELVKA